MPRKTKTRRVKKHKATIPRGEKRIVNDKVGALKMFMTPHNHYFRQVVQCPTGPSPLVLVPGILQQQFLDQGAAFTFDVSQLDQATTFTALYDQYRIVAIKANFISMVNTKDAYDYTLNNNIPGRLFTAFDHDDANPPPNVGSLRQKETCLENNVYRNFSRWIKPHAAGLLYNTSITSGYSSNTSPWIDTSSPAIPHYGLKMMLTGAGFASTRFDAMTLEFEYYVEFRDIV